MGCKKLMLWGAPVFAAVATPSVYAAEGDLVANTVVLPQGVDITGLIQSGVGVLAGVVAIALAAWASWLIVRKCLKWVRKAF